MSLCSRKVFRLDELPQTSLFEKEGEVYLTYGVHKLTPHTMGKKYVEFGYFFEVRISLDSFTKTQIEKIKVQISERIAKKLGL